MATGDLYYNRINLSCYNRALSFGLWSEETSPITPQDEGRVVADAIATLFATALPALLENEARFESVQSWRRYPSPSRAGFSVVAGGAGTRTGDTLPNDNALYINLRQIAADAKYNGGIFIGGCSAADHNDNKWQTAYLVGPVATFTALLDDAFNAVGTDTGQHRFVVLSKRYTPAGTTIGTPFDIVEAVAADRVMSQRRRRQKTQGWS